MTGRPSLANAMLAYGEKGWGRMIRAFGLRCASVVAVVFGVVPACESTQIRDDELSCEDAVAHLQQCCPGFTADQISCTYFAGGGTGGCYASPDEPGLNVPTSTCIRQRACDALVSKGICQEATTAAAVVKCP